jgi:hypothetical protein
VAMQMDGTKVAGAEVPETSVIIVRHLAKYCWGLINVTRILFVLLRTFDACQPGQERQWWILRTL